jgi:hypothetical protein
MAWAYSWFGREDAAKIDDKIATWIRRATGDSPSAIKSLYTLEGIPQGDGNAAYAGGLSCAGMISADNQDWVNAGLTATKNTLSNTYYKKPFKYSTCSSYLGISPS